MRYFIYPDIYPFSAPQVKTIPPGRKASSLSHVGHDEVYDEVAEIDHRDGQNIAKDAADFISRQDGSTPFFLDAGFIETHRTEWVCNGFNQENHSPKDGDGNPGYVQPPAILPDSEATRRDWLDFRHSVERLDGYYGHILGALEKSGLADDTLVLATTDHSIAFPGLKCSLTQHGTGVLYILRLPGGKAAGSVTDALVSHLDILPTIFDLLGEETPEYTEGHSLLPLIHGKTDKVRDTHFAEVTFHAAFEPKRCARTQRWNYIRNFGPPRNTVMPNCDDGHSKRLWMSQGMADRPIPEEELYDLMFDPQERHNVAQNPTHAETLQDLRSRLA